MKRISLYLCVSILVLSSIAVADNTNTWDECEGDSIVSYVPISDGERLSDGELSSFINREKKTKCLRVVNDILISDVITIDGPMVIDANGQEIKFLEKGQFILNGSAAKVIIKNAKINVAAEDSVSFGIRLTPGSSLVIRDSFVKVEMPPRGFKEGESLSSYYDSPAQYTFIELLKERFNGKQLDRGTLIIENNVMENVHSYGARLLRIQSGDLLDEVKISGNYIVGFHGVIYMWDVVNGVIKDNRFLKNSWGNIVLFDAVSTVVSSNRLLFSGNGTTGDAITLYGGKEITIENNVISGASCVGIWVKGENPNGIIVKRNSIFGGITHAIDITANSKIGAYEDSPIKIFENEIGFNKGWAVSVKTMDKVLIQENIFISNNSTSDSQLRIHDGASAILQGNLRMEAYDRGDMGVMIPGGKHITIYGDEI